MQQGAGTGLSLPAVPSSLREASKGPLAEIGGQRTASSEQNVSITRHTSKLSQHIFVSLTEISFVFFFFIFANVIKTKSLGMRSFVNGSFHSTSLL